MIKNTIIILIFLITNFLEVGLLKPFFTHFLFLNLAVIVILASNLKFYNQALFIGFLYGIILDILFASNQFFLPIAFTLGVFSINKLSLWLGEKLMHKIIYILICASILRFVLGGSAGLISAETVFLLIYTLIINFLFSTIKQYVDI